MRGGWFRRWFPVLLTLLAGCAVILAACRWPHWWLYGIGVALLGVAVISVVVRAVGDRFRWKRYVGVIAFALTLVAGFLVANGLNRVWGDVVWSEPSTPAPTSTESPPGPHGYCRTRPVADRIYECTAGRLQVLDAGSGRGLWSQPVYGHDIFVTSTGQAGTLSYSGAADAFYDSDGHRLWSSDKTDQGGYFNPVAARNGTVVFVVCSRDHPGACTYTGVTSRGTLGWRRHFDATIGPTPSSDARIRDDPALPSALVVQTHLPGTKPDHVLILDPETGRTVHDEQLPADSTSDGPPLAIGDQVLISYCLFDQQGCYQALFSDGRKLWGRKGPRLGGLTGVVRVTSHRIYVGAPRHDTAEPGRLRMAVIDRRTGHYRQLPAEEFDLQTVQTHRVDSGGMVCDRVILSYHDQKLVGTDPMSGRRLWSRTVPARFEVVTGPGPGVAVLSDPKLHNPLADHGLTELDRHKGYDSRVWATEITILDPVTGRSTASAYEPDGVNDSQLVGQDSLYVTPNGDGRSGYLVGGGR